MTSEILPNYPVVDFVVGAIADWVKRHRYTVELRKNFANCGPHEIRAIASDLGLTTSDLRELASKGPGAADHLKRMLAALKVNPKALSEIDQRVARDMQRRCITCRVKRRCTHEMAAGTAAKNMHEFCPNAAPLKSLFGGRNPSVAQS